MLCGFKDIGGGTKSRFICFAVADSPSPLEVGMEIGMDEAIVSMGVLPMVPFVEAYEFLSPLVESREKPFGGPGLLLPFSYAPLTPPGPDSVLELKEDLDLWSQLLTLDLPFWTEFRLASW